MSVCDPDTVLIVFAAIGGTAISIPAGMGIGWLFTESLGWVCTRLLERLP